jgi:DNA repair protein RecO (recombination protein O)
MANGLYQTEGIILNRMDVGEADKILSVFTKDFGLLKLFARGVRRTRSKLNSFLNLFSHARIGFVSGRGSWHLIDAEDLSHFDGVILEEERLKILGKMARFVERFHKGEEKDEAMFQTILYTIKMLEKASIEEFDDLELVFYAKALWILGYLDEEDLKDLSDKKNLISAVNRGMASSHL